MAITGCCAHIFNHSRRVAVARSTGSSSGYPLHYENHSLANALLLGAYRVNCPVMFLDDFSVATPSIHPYGSYRGYRQGAVHRGRG